MYGWLSMMKVVLFDSSCILLSCDVFLSCGRFCWIHKINIRKQCPLTLIVELYKLNMKMKTMTKKIMQENKR